MEINRIAFSQIDRAGDLIKISSNEDTVSQAKKIINEWRSQHVFVINTFAMTLKIYAKAIDKKAIVVQRLKKYDSIKSKLIREKTMKLHNMQDIGGCRVIVNTINSIYSILEKYKKSSMRHELIKINDYIESPKKSGYRGIHLIYKYHSDRNEQYNGMFIEIQIRSYLQHLWSTSVETAGVFTRSSLKSSVGDAGWLRFFELTAALISIHEKTNLSKYLDIQPKEIAEEITYLDNKNNFLAQLSAFSVSANKLESDDSKKIKYYLLLLNYQTRRLTIKDYLKKEMDKAQYDYMYNENLGDSINAVLVSGESLSSLKLAYPNYFVKTTEFVELIKKLLKDY